MYEVSGLERDKEINKIIPVDKNPIPEGKLSKTWIDDYLNNCVKYYNENIQTKFESIPDLIKIIRQDLGQIIPFNNKETKYTKEKLYELLTSNQHDQLYFDNNGTIVEETSKPNTPFNKKYLSVSIKTTDTDPKTTDTDPSRKQWHNNKLIRHAHLLWKYEQRFMHQTVKFACDGLVKDDATTNEYSKYWIITLNPNVCGNCRRWTILAVYDRDYTTTFECRFYPIQPDFAEMKKLLNNKYNEILFLKSSDKDSSDKNNNRPFNVDHEAKSYKPCAHSSLLSIIYWINFFELSLIYRKAWKRFKSKNLNWLSGTTNNFSIFNIDCLGNLGLLDIG